MAKGGARNRSGPGVDPNSGRSDARGISFTALPSEGYRGEVPNFPLPTWTEREAALWAQVWTYPQACQWAKEPWRWNTVAMWVRTFVICEGTEATAADKGSLHRFADQIGLTPAGLKENGWALVVDELAGRRAAPVEATEDDPRDRMPAPAPDADAG